MAVAKGPRSSPSLSAHPAWLQPLVIVSCCWTLLTAWYCHLQETAAKLDMANQAVDRAQAAVAEATELAERMDLDAEETLQKQASQPRLAKQRIHQPISTSG